MSQPESTLSLPDAQQIARRLSAALQLPTISYEENSPSAPFLALHQLLAAQYPLVHQHLKREGINQLSLLFTWEGAQPELPGVAFLAHQDVVPAGENEANWTHPPFSGAIGDGYLWGRGVVDMKSQLITLLEAVEALLAAGFKPRRTIYLAFGHDEETGGKQGARAIVAALQQRGVQLDALMDEGGSVGGGVAPGIPGLVAVIAFAEKSYANIKLEVAARAGHASTPGRGGAIGLLSRAITRIERHPMPASLEFARPTIQALLPHLPWPFRLLFGNLWLTGGLVQMALAQTPYSNAMLRNTIAPTLLQAGYKFNVIPERATAFLNCRLLPGRQVDELLAHLRQVVQDERVQITCIDTSAPAKKPVSLDTPYYHDLEKNIAAGYGPIPTCPIVMFGASDARHYEAICSRIYRFQPTCFLEPDEDRTHGVDERIKIDQLPTMVAFNARMMQSWGSR